MSIESIITAVISLSSLGVAVTVMLKTARKNEIDRLSFRIDEMRREIVSHTATIAVLCERCTRSEKAHDDLKSEIRELRK
jgi:uncharacterized membrane-anchored protein YhcB (DUF1043 family)